MFCLQFTDCKQKACINYKQRLCKSNSVERREEAGGPLICDLFAHPVFCFRFPAFFSKSLFRKTESLLWIVVLFVIFIKKSGVGKFGSLFLTHLFGYFYSPKLLQKVTYVGRKPPEDHKTHPVQSWSQSDTRRQH